MEGFKPSYASSITPGYEYDDEELMKTYEMWSEDYIWNDYNFVKFGHPKGIEHFKTVRLTLISINFQLAVEVKVFIKGQLLFGLLMFAPYIMLSKIWLNDSILN